MAGLEAIEAAKHVLLSFTIILAIGAIGGALARKVSVPDIVIFLLAGMSIGPAGLQFVDVPATGVLNQAILMLGACYLLFDGGASLRLNVLKDVWISIVVLSTLGVLISGIFVAVIAHFVMNMEWMIALLLGATIASTDPATLVPIFKQVKVRDRVAQTVMSESAFNDAVAAIATFVILTVAAGSGEFSISKSIIEFLFKAGVGSLIGLSTGLILVYLVSPEKIGLMEGYASVVKLVAIIGCYLLAEYVEASGFMAVFVLGIIIGNRESFGANFSEEDTQGFESFVGIYSSMMRMFIFILLGSQVDFGLMNQYLFEGVIVAALFMLIGRPLTVFLCCLPDRKAKWQLNEMLFMCWTRETGVIPAALAGMLIGMNAPGAKVVAAVTFIAILMTIIIQGSTTKWLAKKLNLLADEKWPY